ncbi:2224_t:CDS:2 [Funneliformis geosporum]|nr:2224_t:CDS:2 [Funneliformis geosporum]
MNISEEKWTIQQSQVPPSPHHPHPAMSPQMNGMPTDNFMQPFQYDGQTAQGQMHPQQMPVYDGINQHNMFIPLKQEFNEAQNRYTQFQR